MSGSEALRVAELTADEIERRLEAGETIEVYMRPRHGLGVMAAGALMSIAFLVQAWWAHGRPGGLVLPFVLMSLPFLSLIPVGVSRYRNPRKVFELTPEGIEAFVRPGNRDRIAWEDVRDVRIVSGGVLFDLDERVHAERTRLERFTRVTRRLMGAGAHDLGLPAKGAQIDEEALFEFLERRVRKGILGGPPRVDHHPEVSGTHAALGPVRPSGHGP